MKMKIRPPRLNGDKVSIFSTSKYSKIRFFVFYNFLIGTPHRPNPFGLSRAKIEKIVGATIYLSGIDLIDGTPIIDISKRKEKKKNRILTILLFKNLIFLYMIQFKKEKIVELQNGLNHLQN